MSKLLTFKLSCSLWRACFLVTKFEASPCWYFFLRTTILLFRLLYSHKNCLLEMIFREEWGTCCWCFYFSCMVFVFYVLHIMCFHWNSWLNHTIILAIIMMRMKLWPKFYTIKTIELKSFLSIFVAERWIGWRPD